MVAAWVAVIAAGASVVWWAADLTITVERLESFHTRQPPAEAETVEIREQQQSDDEPCEAIGRIVNQDGQSVFTFCS